MKVGGGGGGDRKVVCGGEDSGEFNEISYRNARLLRGWTVPFGRRVLLVLAPCRAGLGGSLPPPGGDEPPPSSSGDSPEVRPLPRGARSSIPANPASVPARGAGDGLLSPGNDTPRICRIPGRGVRGGGEGGMSPLWGRGIGSHSSPALRWLVKCESG